MSNRALAYRRNTAIRRSQTKKLLIWVFVLGLVIGWFVPKLMHEMSCAGALEKQDVQYLKAHCLNNTINLEMKNEHL